MAVRFDNEDAPVSSRHDVLRHLASNSARVQELFCSQLLTDDDAEQLEKFFRRHCPSQLRSLQLPKNFLTASSAPALSSIVLHTPALRELDLSDNALEAKGLESLLNEALTYASCRLTSLKLRNTKLGGKDGASKIARLLRGNTSIHTLVLSHNNLKSHGMKEVSASLHHSILRHLDLTQNKLGDRGAAHIAHALDPRTAPDGKLESLVLANNKIRYNGAYHLADAFVKGNNRTLRILDLGDNNIMTEGAEAFGVVLRFSHTLEELNLSRNNIGDDGVRVIAQGLKENGDSALRRLDLSWNGIKDTGAGLLADMLKGNGVLRYLNLRCNFICDGGIRDLALALPHDLALEELDIIGNQWRDPSAMIDALCHHEIRLERLHCEQNHLSHDAESRLRGAFTFRDNKKDWLGKLFRQIREKKQVSCNLSSKKHGDEEIVAISRLLSKHRPKVPTATFGGPLVTSRGVTILSRQVIASNSSHLIRLYIHNSPIRDLGSAALAQALSTNRTLRCLSLMGCQINSDGARMLSNAVRKNGTLTRLSLESNSIGDLGFQDLCNAILEPTHPSLISLNVAHNNITDHGLSFLSSITQLQELHMDGNSLTDYGALTIAKAIYGNESLRWLGLCKTQLSHKGTETLCMFLPTRMVLDHDGRHNGEARRETSRK